MTTQHYLKLGKLCFFFSFLLGSLILGLYVLTADTTILFLGYGYVLFAGIVNLVFLLLLLKRVKEDSANKFPLLRTIGLLLLNIPILLAYAWVVLLLLGTMRITLINNTGTTLTNLDLEGCGGGQVKELPSQAQQTVWVNITGDCSITLVYNIDGVSKQELISGYVTSGMGDKMEYVIKAEELD